MYLDFVQFLYSLQDTAVRFSEDEDTCNSQSPSLTGGYPESLCIVVNDIAVWVHKFPHGGKRLTQKKAWNFIQKQNLENPMTEEEKSRKIVLATDSDNFMYDNAIANLAYNFEKHPGKYAFAGYMTCMSSGWPAVLNPWRLIQDTEYVGGEMNRAFELCLGTVNCLPGGFTALRYSKFEQVAERYFTDLPDTTITDYHRNYLGEDRYLTHIMHQEFPRYSMGFCPAARCKTDPPTRLMGLVKQRRRWYLGALSNEAFMFTDRRIFEKYKLMVCYKFLSLCWWRSFTFTQIILASFLFHDIDFSSWEGIRMQALAVGIPFILNYLVICETGIKIHHYKVVWVALFSLLPQLFISFCVDVNVVMTFYQRSWGGARVEAAADKAKESGNSDDIDGLKEKLIERQNTPSDAFYRDPYIVVQLSSTETNSDSEQSYTSTESLNEFQRA